MVRAKRYFVVDSAGGVMHIFGACQQTKPRAVPIRLFDTPQALEAWAGRPLRLCSNCRKKADL